MKVWTLLSISIIAIAAPTSKADRPVSRMPLYELAQGYELAVENFEKVVLQVRGIDRTDEKLVDRLDDESARFRAAARIPRHLNRLFYRWQDVQKLQTQVEQRIFRKYTPNYALICAWDAVVYCQLQFAQELLIHVENPRHVDTVRRVASSNSWRDRYFQAAARAR